MKKLLIVSVLFAFLFCGMIYATETRVLTMGNANEIVKDEANVMLFPSTINYYPKLVGGELRSSSDYVKDGYTSLTDFYAHWAFGEKGNNPLTVGTYFYTNDDGIYWPTLLGPNFIDVSPPQFYYYDKRYYPDMPNRRLTLILGKKMGDIPVGLSINYISSKYEFTDTSATDKETASLSRLAFLLGASPMDGKLDLSAGVAFTSYKDEYYNYSDTLKGDGMMAFSFNARYFMDPMGKYTLVPHIGFAHEKQGVKDNVPNKMELTFTGFEGGLGMNYAASEDVLLVGDLGFMYFSGKQKLTPNGGTVTEYDSTSFALPYFKTGIDAKIFDWLKLRGGVWSRWNMDKVEEKQGWKDQDKFSYVSTTTYLGAGFHWNKLNLDAQIDPDFLARGPYFISGESGYLSWKLSMVYWID
jgi:hypothetical protein